MVYLASGHSHTFIRRPRWLAHTHLHSVASQGGGPFKPPALLLGHHEELGQALLHDPGEALVVQAHQRIVHALEHCGGRRQRGCSEDGLPADSETTTTPGPALATNGHGPYLMSGLGHPYLISPSQQPQELGITVLML